MLPASTSRSPRLDWVWGGAMLIAAAVLPFSIAGTALSSSEILVVLGHVAFAVAMVLFALGRHSAVARRPLGVVALLALAVLAFADYVFVFAPTDLLVTPESVPVLIAVGYAFSAAQIAFALIAAVQVVRAGVVPRPMNRFPLWAIGLTVIPAVIGQVLLVALGPGGIEILVAWSTLIALAQLAALLGLGVAAVVAGMRPRGDETVPILSSPPPTS